MEQIRKYEEKETLSRTEYVERKPLWILFAWIGGIFFGIVLFATAVDYLLLQGKKVDSARNIRFDLANPDVPVIQSLKPEITVTIRNPGEEHTLLISTFPQQLMLKWSLESPEGWRILSGYDIAYSKTARIIRFVPQTAGPHVLRLERSASQPRQATSGIIRPSTIDRVNISVLLNDRSFIRPLLRRSSPLERIIGSDR